MGTRQTGGKKKWIVATERDLAMFRFLAEEKFATKEQLARRFFPNAQAEPTRPLRVCYRRLLELRQFGLLECRPVVLGGTPLYQASRLALGQLAEADEPVLPYLDNVDVRTFEHDRRVTDVRVALEWLGATEWRSERSLLHRGWRGHPPDATFAIGGTKLALELELSLKRKDRYEEIFRGYALDPGRLVLYLCGTPGMRRALLRTAARSPEPSLFYFGLWDEWAEKEAACELEGRRDSLRLLDLL
jgi:hypothetical protein